MRTYILSALVALVFVLVSPLAAQDFDETELKNLAYRGNVEAQTTLGNYYVSEALGYEFKAEQSSSDEDAENWNFLANQAYNAASLFYRFAAAEGNAEAQNELGHLYISGNGREQNHAEGLRLIRLAAEQGYAQAQTDLAVLYLDNEIVERDVAEAIKWYRLAADQGEPFAQIELSCMYFEGNGVSKDYVLAHMWANINGDIDWVKELEEDYMTPAQIAEAEKLAREWRPK